MHTVQAYWKLRKETFRRVNPKEAAISNIVIIISNLFVIFIFLSPVTAFSKEPFSNIFALMYMSMVIATSSFFAVTYLASFAKKISHDPERIARNYFFNLDFLSFLSRISLPLFILGYKINTKQDGLNGAVFGSLEVLSVKTGLVEKKLILRINDSYYSPYRDEFEAEFGYIEDIALANHNAVSKNYHLPVIKESYIFLGSKPFTKEWVKLNKKAFKFLMLKIFLMNNLDGFGIIWLNDCTAKSIVAAYRLKLDVEKLSSYIKYNINIKDYDNLRDLPNLYLHKLSLSEAGALDSRAI